MSFFIIIGLVCFLIGIWAGLGAPGWPRQVDEGRRHTAMRPLHPGSRVRARGRARPTPRRPGERRFGDRD